MAYAHPEDDPSKYTRGVVTLYYRAPEIIVGHDYDHKSDMWSLGCIFAELLNFGKPILPGKNDEHQFELICSLIGKPFSRGFPTTETWAKFFSDKTKELVRFRRYTFYRENKLRTLFPSVSDLALNLLGGLLVWNPKKRMSAQRAILHPYFYDKPLPKMPEQITALKKFDYYKARVREMMLKKNKVN